MESLTHYLFIYIYNYLFISFYTIPILLLSSGSVFFIPESFSQTMDRIAVILAKILVCFSCKSFKWQIHSFASSLPLDWQNNRNHCGVFEKMSMPQAALTGKETEGSRQGLCPRRWKSGACVVLLAGSWLCWGRNLRDLIFTPVFIRISNTPFETCLELQDFSSGGHPKPNSFVTQLLPVPQFQFIACWGLSDGSGIVRKLKKY